MRVNSSFGFTASVSKEAADAAASSSGDADSKSSTAFIVDREDAFNVGRRRGSSSLIVQLCTSNLRAFERTPSEAPPTGGGRVTRGAPSAVPIRSLNALASAFIPGLIASISSMQFFTSARYAAYRALCAAAPRSLCLPMVSTTREQKAMRTRKSSWWLPSSL